MNHTTAEKVLTIIQRAADAVSVLRGTDGAAAARLGEAAVKAVESVIETSARRARVARASRRRTRRQFASVRR